MPHDVKIGTHTESGRPAWKCATCGRGGFAETPQMALAHARRHVVANPDPEPTRTATRRTAEEVSQHRQSILDAAGEDWGRPPKDARAGDIDHLVRSGQLESEVREEWDPQKGRYSHAYFGGAGVVKRKRRYIRRPGEPA